MPLSTTMLPSLLASMSPFNRVVDSMITVGVCKLATRWPCLSLQTQLPPCSLLQAGMKSLTLLTAQPFMARDLNITGLLTILVAVTLRETS